MEFLSMLIVYKRGARFDFEKAKWVNKEHLAMLSAKDIITIMVNFLKTMQMF